MLWKSGDGTIIDGLGPDGVAARVLDVTGRVVKLQTGYLYHYAFAMLIGVALIITWFMFQGGVPADRRAFQRHRRDREMSIANTPILSLITFLPLFGALLVAFLSGGDDGGQAQCAMDRAVDDARSRSLFRCRSG